MKEVYERFKDYPLDRGCDFEEVIESWERYDFIPEFLPGDRVKIIAPREGIKETIVLIDKYSTWYPYILKSLSGKEINGAWAPHELVRAEVIIDEEGNLI